MDSLVHSFRNDLTFTNLRTFFYLVTPNETTFKNVEDVPDYLNQARPWFLLLVFMEVIVCKITGKDGYALNDSITSMNAGILSMLLKFSGRAFSLTLYTYIYNNYRLLDVPYDSVLVWIFSFLAQDLAYYLAHRAVHEAGIFWSFHQMHHSSEYYNLSTALRQGCIQEIGTMVFECMQSIIAPPAMFVTHKSLNTLYQFWIHNEVIPKLGPLEFFLNTPSHHRVHHGRNPYCIDKNYAGVLIIWDRIFGTFEPEREEEKPVYGLVTNVRSFDALWLQLFEFKELGWDKGRLRDEHGRELFPGWWGKFTACFGPPGFFPGVKTKQFFWWRCMQDSTEGIPSIEEKVQKYNPPLNLVETLYVVSLFIASISGSGALVQHRNEHSWSQFLAHLMFLLSTVQVTGYYLDKRSFAVNCDLLRLSFVCLYSAAIGNWFLSGVSLISAIYAIILIGNSSKGNTEDKRHK